MSAIGNHEWDHGIENALKNFIESKDKIKWLCSNIELRVKKASVIKNKYGINYKDIEIHDELLLTVKDKKIGIFAVLGKETTRKMSTKNKKDFLEIFALDPDISEVSRKCVESLK